MKKTPPPRIHAILMDGTLCSLRRQHLSNVGLICELLREVTGRHFSLYYEPGIEYTGRRSILRILTGKGTNAKIRYAYGALASRYTPGDKVFLIGYSRGAYSARSLAGVIDTVGLLHQDCATSRFVRQAFRHYQFAPHGMAAAQFRKNFCHQKVNIEAIGVFDTVKALGIALPWIWHFFDKPHRFHSHALGGCVKAGFHALALDETRNSYAPIMWDCTPNWQGQLEQMWFKGTHGDIGGYFNASAPNRGLSNIPLVWMLERLESRGLPLPTGWRERFDFDVTAPVSPLWHGAQMLLLSRQERDVGAHAAEAIHPSVPQTHKARLKIAAS